MQTKQPYSNHATTVKRPWLWLVLVGFLWLQFAGVVHKHSHTGLPATSSQLEQLLPDHSQQNKSDCQLLDLQCGGFALSATLPTLTPAPIQAAFEGVPFQSAFQFLSQDYQARAPPITSI